MRDAVGVELIDNLGVFAKGTKHRFAVDFFVRSHRQHQLPGLAEWLIHFAGWAVVLDVDDEVALLACRGQGLGHLHQKGVGVVDAVAWVELVLLEVDKKHCMVGGHTCSLTDSTWL